VGATSAFDRSDIVAETFLHAFRDSAREAYDPSRPFVAYLLGIARNVVLSRLRKKTELLTDDGDAEDRAAAQEIDLDDPETRLLRDELVQLVRRFGEELDASERPFFEARFREGRPLVPAARAAGLSRQAARALDERLSRRLRAYLARAGYTGTRQAEEIDHE
jgi:RNA polymerase sigma factor (sigma-70 family)